MPYPSLTFAQLLDNATRQELEQFVSLLQGYLSVQHKEDGTHSAVTADSLTLTGALAGTTATLTGLTVNGPAAVNGTTTLTQTGTVGALANIDATGSFGQVLYKANGTTATVTFEWNHTGAVKWLMNTGVLFQWRDVSNNLVLQATNAGLLERNRSVAIGDWTSVSFSSASFLAGGAQTWGLTSPDQTTLAYTLIGKTMTVVFALDTTSVGGVPDPELRILVPGSFTIAQNTVNPIRVLDNGAPSVGHALVVAGQTVIRCFNDMTGTTNWAASVNNTYLQGQITFEVQ